MKPAFPNDETITYKFDIILVRPLAYDQTCYSYMKHTRCCYFRTQAITSADTWYSTRLPGMLLQQRHGILLLLWRSTNH